jgi:glycerophosphoryl diester phosphodiesterase
LDAGIRSGNPFAGERIPTLHEALDCIGDKVRVCIEIKGDTTDAYIRHARYTVDVLHHRGNLRNVVISSFNSECLRAIKAWEPLIVTTLDPDRQDGTYSAWQLCEKVLACGANFLMHRYETLTVEIVDECHQHGFSLWTWTTNKKDDMRRVLPMGVDAIMTDYPRILRQVIDQTAH